MDVSYVHNSPYLMDFLSVGLLDISRIDEALEIGGKSRSRLSSAAKLIICLLLRSNPPVPC